MERSEAVGFQSVDCFDAILGLREDSILFLLLRLTSIGHER